MRLEEEWAAVKVSGKIVGANIDFRTNKPCLTLEINERRDFELLVDELKDKEKLSIEIKQWRERRSLDANAYCWVLIDKLATRLGTTKVEIYREFIKDVGANNEVVCVRNNAVERLCYAWERNGLGWLTETFESKISGCTNVILYYGSSTYDTAQMSRLINLVVEACKEQGIETMTPAELSRLVEMWGE